MITRFLLWTIAPEASRAQTLAFTGSARRTGAPGGTSTTRVGPQPCSVNASGKTSGKSLVFGAVFTRDILLLDQLVERSLHQALADAEKRVHV